MKMKKESNKSLFLSIIFLITFIIWTLIVSYVDKENIGPNNSSVGLGTINGFFHSLIGVNFSLYNVTDWLGIVPIVVAMGFAVLGLAQWIKRKSIKNVDYSLFVLGGFYVLVFLIYVAFEYLVINYRPILINGNLEASYPSTTTLLVMAIMPTTIMQLNIRVKNLIIKRILTIGISVFIVFMVVARFVSGVHWFSDIMGGVLLSIGLVYGYSFAVRKCELVFNQ